MMSGSAFRTTWSGLRAVAMGRICPTENKKPIYAKRLTKKRESCALQLQAKALNNYLSL